jgi:hypothetical protein
LPDSYQASVEINILDQNYSITLEEYLDYTGKKGLMSIYKQGNTEMLIFSYDTNEVFDIASK